MKMFPKSDRKESLKKNLKTMTNLKFIIPLLTGILLVSCNKETKENDLSDTNPDTT
jgi:hypothetical protein